MSSFTGVERVVRPSTPASPPNFGVPWLSLGGAVVIALLTVVFRLPAIVPLVAAALIGACAGGEGALRARRHSRLVHESFQRSVAAFDRDLDRGLTVELEMLLSRVDGDASPFEGGPVVSLGRGEVTSTILISRDGALARAEARPALTGAPLLVRAAGGVRVLGPPHLARRVARGYAAQLLRREPGSTIVEPVVGSDSVGAPITVAVPRKAARVACRFEVGDRVDDGHEAHEAHEAHGAHGATSNGGGRSDGSATEVWIGPDGSARARTLDQAGGAWVSVDPELGPAGC